jgi:uncharacterized protein YkwD
MTRLRVRGAIALVAAAVLACSAPGLPDTSPASPLAERVVSLTNAERARKRMAPLTPSPRLMRAAQMHAEQMARAGRLDHELPRAKYPRPEDRLSAVKYSWRVWAENVAYGPTTAEDVHQLWMKSAEHRANILNSRLTETGVGHATDTKGRIYWTQVFAVPLS